MDVSGLYKPGSNGEDTDKRAAAHVIGNIFIKSEAILWFSNLHRTERGNIISPLLQGRINKMDPIKPCVGSRRPVGPSQSVVCLTGLKMEPCRSMRPDSTIFTHVWSLSSSTVFLNTHSLTPCLWGEQDTPYLWNWWRPTERAAPSRRGTHGPQTVTSALHCSCRNMTEF